MTTNSVEVTCPSCGDQRWVARETSSRIRNGKAPASCRRCRVGSPRARESDLRWWLRRFGVDPGDQPVRVFVQAHGLPEPLGVVASGFSAAGRLGSPVHDALD